VEKIAPDPLDRTRRVLPGVIIAIAVLTAGAFLFHHTFRLYRERQQHARKEAFVRADRLALYSNLRFLEEHRHQTIADLIRGPEARINLNATLVHLLAESHISSAVTVSNVAGADMFVDSCGVPYQFTIISNAGMPNAFGRHIERRIIIEQGGPH
jgi:hypothetical protein